MLQPRALTKIFSLFVCASYLVACTDTGAPSPNDGALLGSMAGREDKADGPDAVADWQVRSNGDDSISVVGTNSDGGYVAHFVLRAVDFEDDSGTPVASGIAVSALLPEIGYREITTSGQVRMDNMTPRLNGLLAQLQEDIAAGQGQEPDDAGKGDLSESCSLSLWALVGTAISGLLCPLTGITCLVGVATAATSAVSGLICLIGLATDAEG